MGTIAALVARKEKLEAELAEVLAEIRARAGEVDPEPEPAPPAKAPTKKG